MTKNHAALVDRAIELDKLVKKHRKELDEIKAELTTLAFEDMDNKSLKFKQLYGKNGSFSASYREKFEIDNYSALIETLGEIALAKVTRKEEVKYDVETRFKEALIAVFKQEYSNEMALDEILVGLGLDDKAIKVARRKLKGDYIKDKRVLESLGVVGDCEEELYAIRLCKNQELVDRFFEGLEPEQIEEIKKAVFVEDSIAVGFDYEA